MHLSQVFLYLLLAFMMGVFAGSFFSIPQDAVWVSAAISLLLVAIFFRRGSKVLNLKIAFGAFLAMFFLFGVARFNLVHTGVHILEKFARASAELKNVSPENRLKVTLVGYVDGEPETIGDRQRIILKSKSLLTLNRTIMTDERVLITIRLHPSYSYGQTLSVVGELLLPKNFADSDSDFDYISYLAKDGIYTLMRYPQIGETALELPFFEKTKVALLKKVFVVKRAFEQSVNRSVAEPNASFINGILLGSRGQIPENIKNDFSRTSTSHILAISGYNITLIAGIISWFFLLFMRRPVAFWFSLAGILLFTILTGAQASVIRAAIMGLVLLVAQREGRLYGARNAVVFAGSAMVLTNPNILRYDLGFQLSFMATLGLIYLAPIFEKWTEGLSNFFKLRETLVMTTSAQIFVLPLILYHFKNLSLVALPANILILPLVPYTMALGFVMGLAGLILPFLGQLVGYFVWLVSSIQLGVIHLFAKPDWAALSVVLPWYGIGLIYFLIVHFLRRANQRF